MAEGYLKQTALSHLGLSTGSETVVGEAGVSLAEMPPRAQLALRGESDDKAFLKAFADGVGFKLPVNANSSTAKGRTAAPLARSKRMAAL